MNIVQMFYNTTGSFILNFIMHIFAYLVIVAYKLTFEYIRQIKNILVHVWKMFILDQFSDMT